MHSWSERERGKVRKEHGSSMLRGGRREVLVEVREGIGREEGSLERRMN